MRTLPTPTKRHRTEAAMYRYVWIYFCAALLLVGIGFFPSYFSKLTTTDPAHHVHAIITTLRNSPTK